MPLLVGYLIVTLDFFEKQAWAIPAGIGLELLLPRAGQPAQRLKGMALWAIYFVLGGLFLTADGYIFGFFGVRPLFNVRSGSPWIVPAVLAAALVSDFFYYWCHRLQHTPLLWRFHAVHHSIRDMSAANSFHHWTEEPIHFVLLGIPMALLIQVSGPFKEAFAALLVLQTVYNHTPTRLHLGPLSRVFVDNRFHRHHHVRDESRSGYNFGVFTTIWDQLFATAYFPAPEEWPEVGLVDRPEVEGLRDYLWPRGART
jgi:sterol desaturase/sphingolipid hydroxylase (fatty acid hydroxylase superfamily)